MALNLKNYSYTWILPTVCSPKTTFNISKLSVAFSTSSKKHLINKYGCLKPAIFQAFQSHKWNNTHLYLTRHYSTITHAAALLEVENDSADFSLSTHNGRGTRQQQQCHFKGSSETNHLVMKKRYSYKAFTPQMNAFLTKEQLETNVFTETMTAVCQCFQDIL